MGVDVGLEKVINETGDESPEHVFQELVAGRMQLWAVSKQGKPIATMITQMEHRPAVKTLVVRYLVGRLMGEWVATAHEALQEFARAQQCNAIEAWAREGLRSHLTPLGWSKAAVLFHLPIEAETPADG